MSAPYFHSPCISSSDLHYQEVKNILPKELPTYASSKGALCYHRWARFRHSQEATTEKPGKLWVPGDNSPLDAQELEISSGKSLQLVKPIQAPHKEPKSKPEALESQAVETHHLLSGTSRSLSLWDRFHWSRQPFLSHYCLQNGL